MSELGAFRAMSEQIIGEALKRLERLNESAFERIQNGRKIIGMRNVLAHGYDAIDYRILWTTLSMISRRLLSKYAQSLIVSLSNL